MCACSHMLVFHTVAAATHGWPFEKITQYRYPRAQDKWGSGAGEGEGGGREGRREGGRRQNRPVSHSVETFGVVDTVDGRRHCE